MRVFNHMGDSKHIAGTSDEFKEWGRVRYVRAILEYHNGAQGGDDDSDLTKKERHTVTVQLELSAQDVFK